MILATFANPRRHEDQVFEIVERKGAGHPDTLADAVAEAISRAYCNYCIEQFGAVLHHNTDKTALLGGSAHVTFGEGHMTSPMLAIVNGRMSTTFGTQAIPVGEIVELATRDCLTSVLPLVDRERDIAIRSRISEAPSPGLVSNGADDAEGGRLHWFAPRGLEDLSELKRLRSNDTSCGAGYAPLTMAELLTLEIERRINGLEFKSAAPQFGSDVKVMVCRKDRAIHMTTCVPQIARHTPSLRAYLEQKQEMLEQLCSWSEEICEGAAQITVDINTRDNEAIPELYLTATGSSLESGDEGVVGRGNRANGLISVLRPMSMEGAAGKNPIYHIGKLYNLIAQDSASRLYQATGRATSVCLVSQSGRPLKDPWFAAVEQSGSEPVDRVAAERFIAEAMDDLPRIQSDLFAGECVLF